jgi:hypothetical protein
MMPTKAPAAATSTPAACINPWDFITTNCQLTWYVITIYGTPDAGGGWQRHGESSHDTFPAPASYYILRWPGCHAGTSGSRWISKRRAGIPIVQASGTMAWGMLASVRRATTHSVFRQNAPTMDGVIAYDPVAYAFSPLAFSGITWGVGDTEDCRTPEALDAPVKADAENRWPIIKESRIGAE